MAVDNDDVGPDVLVPLQAMMDNYWKGKVTNEDFSYLLYRWGTCEGEDSKKEGANTATSGGPFAWKGCS